MDEHEFEASPGLPEPLPEGERLLWQGSPDWKSLARRAYHLPELAGYFAVLWAWYVGTAWYDGAPLGAAIAAGFVPLAMGAVCLGFLAWAARAAARGAVYTVTDRRVVLRHGVALPMCVNLPFALVEGASLKAWADGSGDVALQLVRGQRVGYLVSWPHVRPWRFTRTEPALRCIPDAERVGRLVAQALADYHGLPLRAPATVATPVVADAARGARTPARA
ncbi:MAG: photosynthetic complex putative assembly protein PuhB [Steroidobacteraceae bacterium]|jgi:hypothetical protein|nr:photosynthetic complex putative assembly protein PuhB [Steroidobacteraceae bacterium]